MQRIFNDPEQVVEDTVSGFLKAHGDLVAAGPSNRVVRLARGPIKGKVGVVTGGGSGHEPAFLGFTGENLIDAVAIGEVFSSPTAKAFQEAFEAADGGAGIACLFGNFQGDVLNVKMAARQAKKAGLDVQTVIANDDVASAPADQRDNRRGSTGEILMWKVGGAMAAEGAPLDEVIRVSQKAIDNCRSMGVGLAPCTIPAVGKPNFSIEPGTMEIGIGHHGEPGIEVAPLASADGIADAMVGRVVEDMPFEAGTEVAVLLSGLGATPVNEIYILYNSIAERIEGRGLKIHRPFVGNYFTSLDMVGVTLTVMAVDDELKRLLDMPATSVAMTHVAPGR